ncbi:uncharacterized protein [Dysidea avara]|uniref:uncharacterized protein isoform X2 n=1 Tax=Dysidea avara TaxID=196820 RepID=UPI003327BD32
MYRQQKLSRLQADPDTQSYRAGRKPLTSTAMAAAYIDDYSERNEAFYAGRNAKVMYPKQLVYPPNGGEFSLEELRAAQYPCEEEDDENGMEMTEVIYKDITTNIPVVQIGGGKNKLQNTRISNGAQRKPLAELQPVDEELEELEELMDKKPPVVLKASTSFGVSNVSYKSDQGDGSLCYGDISSFHKKLNFSDIDSTNNISNVQNSMSYSNLQFSVPHSNAKSFSLRDSMSHSRCSHKVYPKTPVLRAPTDVSNLSDKLSLFDDVDNDSQLDQHHSAAQLQEQDLMDDSAESSWEVASNRHKSVSIKETKVDDKTANSSSISQRKKRESIQLDPIPAEHTSKFQLSVLADQSTQFDIPRPVDCDDYTSTPYPTATNGHVNNNKPAPVSRTRSKPQQTPWNLSLISEESDIRSSSSSSSSSSMGSRGAWLKGDKFSSTSREGLPKDINPYHTSIVQYMCNNVSNSIKPPGQLEESFPSLLNTDATITLGGHNYLIKKLIGKGAFATIYLAIDDNGDKKALKVQSPACPWEYYISEELHCRLVQSKIDINIEHFMTVEASYMSTNCSVLVTSYEALGTMLDLVNTIKTSRRNYSVDEDVVAFYAAELVTMVNKLHQCHVIHGDIKPDNIMIVDIRGSGKCALKLIDFGRSIDMKAFDPCTQFTGSSNTSGFVCTEMKTGKPWSWQVDYYALAATIYCMMHGNYMDVIRMPGVGYKPRRNPPKLYSGMALWNKLFTQLLNTDLQKPSLDQLANQLEKLVNNNNTVMSSIRTLLNKMTPA